MVLCEILRFHEFQFSVAHCNFQLRGEESNADEAFVKDYCASHNIPFYVQRFDTLKFSEENKCSIQVAARELRYNWFQKLLEENKIAYLLTAHHSGDNVETVLMNLFKGTGIHGLTGIAAKRDKIIRPLLFASKQEIAFYAKMHGITWREDASNASNKYTRNFFRNKVIPLVEELVPNAMQNVASTISHLQEAETLYKQAIETYRKTLLVYKNGEVHIPVIKFGSIKPFDTVAWEIIKDFGFNANAITDLKQLLQAATGKYISSGTHRIIKNRKWLIVAPLSHGIANNIIIDEEDREVVFNEGKLLISKTVNKELSADRFTALIDARKIQYPLLLRRWKTGDYFYPLGMAKKKKIARFLIDQKLSQTEKEKTWVLVSNDKITWLIGQRIDDRFKLTETTKEVLKIKVVNGS